MADYDVIIIGGGINGLTCAAYLGKAGLKTLLLEARGQCGTHCDTTEPGIPGFLHNLHATWLTSAMSPAMADLDLARFGLEWRATDIAFGKTFSNGENVLIGPTPSSTAEHWQKVSPEDAARIEIAGDCAFRQMDELVEVLHTWMYTAPALEKEAALGRAFEVFLKNLGVNVPYGAFTRMNGFEVLDLIYRSEAIKSTLQSLSRLAGFNPEHPRIGALGAAMFGSFTGSLFPVHQCRGGSHGLTHALVKAAVRHGVTILPCCPVRKIEVENGRAAAVVLAPEALYPNQAITAKKIVSNLSVVPTFIDLVGEAHIAADLARRIRNFRYNAQNVFVVNYATDSPPRFASADFDEGIGRTFMGSFGGDNTAAMRAVSESLHRQAIHDEVIVNWYVPTLADPIQAPPGCHVVSTRLDVPPEPVSWNGRKLDGFSAWDEIKHELADRIDDAWEQYAPGFNAQVRERIVYSPLDQYRNNPSAVLGSRSGGAVIPEQFYENRPVPGVLRDGGSRTFIDDLYLSNSIHVFGNTMLSSGYIAAAEVAEDMGARDCGWWGNKAFSWHLENGLNVAINLGVKHGHEHERL